MTEKTKSSPMFKEFTVEKVIELSYFDITGERAKTKNSSNKSYHAELELEKSGTRAQIYTLWGPVGGHQTADWRYYDSQDRARKEFDSIINSKKKKGYKEIDVAQRTYGSEEAKQIVKSVELKNANSVALASKLNLHKETQRLINSLLGSTQSFVTATLKCPLGQLTNKQIDLGREKLNEAKHILDTRKKLSTEDNKKLQNITNDFYSLIPHNLGQGARGKLLDLLIDSTNKIAGLEDELDTLLDAKDIGVSLTSDNIDDKYLALNTDFNYIDHTNPLFIWVQKMVLETRAHNHRWLGNINVLNIWGLKRNKEYDIFYKRASEIAKECGKHNIPDILHKHVKARIDLDKERNEIYSKANVIPLFHGTRTQNVSGIIKNGLLIRPAGVILCGNAYGNGVYMASNSSKSINYVDLKNSYWAKGYSNTGFLFLNDCTLGNQLIANRYNHQYTKQNIRPHHSVWAKGGADLINDEFILYDINQHNIRYLIEFSCE